MDGQNGQSQRNGDDDLNGNRDTIQRSICTTLTNESDFQESYLDSQEPIFPPLLQLSEELDQQYLIVRGERVTWYRPTRLDQLLQLKSQFPHAKIVVGNTEVALEMKFKHCDYPVLISPAMIAETLAIERTEEGLILGGAVTLSMFKEELERQVQQGPKESTRFFSALNQMLHWFAGKQIRNVAAIAGNIMTGSPISDLNPLFMAAGCVLTLQSHSKGIRSVTMDNHFFTGYRRNIVQPEEILLNISIPRTKADEYVNGYKQSRRREDDIAIVNGAFRVLFHPGSSKIQEMSMAFGGMAPTTVMAVGTMDKLVGRCWDDDSLVEDVCRWMLEDLPLPPSVPGGMSSYRQSLCLSFFFKFHLQVLRDLVARRIVTSSIPDNLSGAELDIERGKFKSAQLFELVPKDQLDLDPVGRPLAHVAGEKHVTGEAIYCDDLPPVAGELHMALVLSNQAHAEIVSIDPSAALELEGVRGFFSAKDIASGRNVFGPIIHDEEVFASKRVTCCGQVIACVVADNLALAQRASRLVRVTYSPSDGPAIFTIQDAIKNNSFYHGHSREIIQGDVEAGFRNAQHVLEGTFEMGGQEHFYLETQSVLVVPKGEDGEMDITSSTQNPSEVQQVVAEVLGLPANRVVCRVKRMGGGFGGKETRSAVLAAPAAVASYRLQRPVRCMLDRDEDMMSTGIRHPFLAKYKVGFDSTGRLTALDVQLFSNGGNTMDLSRGIMERAVFHIDNAYRIENLRCHGIVCRTNLPSNTAFRGFGGPQGMAVVENVMVDVASYLGLDPTAVRSLNLYREGDSTHYNQRLDYCTLDRCWNECQALAGLKDRRKEIESFNRLHRFKKRGLAIIPTKFGIAFTALFLNQAGALVHVYKDGSVLLTHGGTEMGQGLHTKMLQVASRALNIPVDLIFISETSTDKVPNTSPTAASAGSDLNGMAVLVRCDEIIIGRYL
jgi:xanthine dehydrogenase/oxidase